MNKYTFKVGVTCVAVYDFTATNEADAREELEEELDFDYRGMVSYDVANVEVTVGEPTPQESAGWGEK